DKCMQYTPFIDSIGIALVGLKSSILGNKEKFENKKGKFAMFFEDLSTDLTTYVKVAGNKGICDSNLHILHLPTVKSIESITAMIDSEEIIETGDLELF
ncbi:hypothetical protein KAR91_66115, partial [Candidatus Pacearchaeota archaeon]|nr:hypothetical protein [Candidatus Pacearchaeota archaeon]